MFTFFFFQYASLNTIVYIHCYVVTGKLATHNISVMRTNEEADEGRLYNTLNGLIADVP